jgi:hypothetical protein
MPACLPRSTDCYRIFPDSVASGGISKLSTGGHTTSTFYRRSLQDNSSLRSSLLVVSTLSIDSSRAERSALESGFAGRLLSCSVRPLKNPLAYLGGEVAQNQSRQRAKKSFASLSPLLGGVRSGGWATGSGALARKTRRPLSLFIFTYFLPYLLTQHPGNIPPTSH